MSKGLDLLGSLYSAALLTAIAFGPVWAVYHFNGAPGVLGVLAWVVIISGSTLAILFAFGLEYIIASWIWIFGMLLPLSVLAFGVWIALRIAPPRSGVLIVTLPIGVWTCGMLAFWIPFMQQLGRAMRR